MNEESKGRDRFLIAIAYDGRNFSGWQSQAGGDTVQDTLLAALRTICPEVATVQGSGRTDAGVSADGQTAHFDAPAHWRMDATAWQKALNAHLPPAIRILSCRAVPADFHARFSASGKVYRYEIHCGPVLPPLRHGLAWHQPRLSGERAEADLRRALARFAGRHDFRAFSAKRRDGRDESRNTVRELAETTLEVADGGDTLRLGFHGNGFLYKMVRFLVGSCAWHALGKLPLESIDALLENRAGENTAPFCAPPDGLRLLRVEYPRLLRGSGPTGARQDRLH